MQNFGFGTHRRILGHNAKVIDGVSSIADHIERLSIGKVKVKSIGRAFQLFDFHPAMIAETAMQN
jgi:hypothetical protein